MIKRTLWSLPLLLLVACGAKEPANPPADNTNLNEDNGGNGHGKRQSLGKMTAFGREFEVLQFGHVSAIELAFASGKERISTVRTWIGVESGDGSMKAKMGIEGKANMHGHISMPKPIPEGSKLWLDFEVDGKHEVHSLAYK